MKNPGTQQNNFLSSRGVKVLGDGKPLSGSNNLSSLPLNQQGLSLYFNLMKNKRLPETKKASQKAKQVVLRSPSSQVRQSGTEMQDSQDLTFENKENSKKIGNISKFTASKILFPEERRTPK
jgi:hypothetical protein